MAEPQAAKPQAPKEAPAAAAEWGSVDEAVKQLSTALSSNDPQFAPMRQAFTEMEKANPNGMSAKDFLNGMHSRTQSSFEWPKVKGFEFSVVPQGTPQPGPGQDPPGIGLRDVASAGSRSIADLALGKSFRGWMEESMNEPAHRKQVEGLPGIARGPVKFLEGMAKEGASIIDAVTSPLGILAAGAGTVASEGGILSRNAPKAAGFVRGGSRALGSIFALKNASEAKDHVEAFLDSKDPEELGHIAAEIPQIITGIQVGSGKLPGKGGKAAEAAAEPKAPPAPAGPAPPPPGWSAATPEAVAPARATPGPPREAAAAPAVQDTPQAQPQSTSGASDLAAELAKLKAENSALRGDEKPAGKVVKKAAAKPKAKTAAPANPNGPPPPPAAPPAPAVAKPGPPKAGSNPHDIHSVIAGSEGAIPSIVDAQKMPVELLQRQIRNARQFAGQYVAEHFESSKGDPQKEAQLQQFLQQAKDHMDELGSTLEERKTAEAKAAPQPPPPVHDQVGDFFNDARKRKIADAGFVVEVRLPSGKILKDTIDLGEGGESVEDVVGILSGHAGTATIRSKDPSIPKTWEIHLGGGEGSPPPGAK